jgi:hypothetical protein
MIGEASQKAITADKGTPIASSAAISGITPQEQKGEMPPASAPNPIIRSGAPVKARAIRLSAPVALAQAAMAIDRTRKGAVPRSAWPAKSALSAAWGVSKTASAARISAEASQTRWSCCDSFYQPRRSTADRDPRHNGEGAPNGEITLEHAHAEISSRVAAMRRPAASAEIATITAAVPSMRTSPPTW